MRRGRESNAMGDGGFRIPKLPHISDADHWDGRQRGVLFASALLQKNWANYPCREQQAVPSSVFANSKALPPLFWKDPPPCRHTAKSLPACSPFFAHLGVAKSGKGACWYCLHSVPGGPQRSPAHPQTARRLYCRIWWRLCAHFMFGRNVVANMVANVVAHAACIVPNTPAILWESEVALLEKSVYVH